MGLAVESKLTPSPGRAVDEGSDRRSAARVDMDMFDRHPLFAAAPDAREGLPLGQERQAH
jgi:hypothetical protein